MFHYGRHDWNFVFHAGADFNAKFELSLDRAPVNCFVRRLIKDVYGCVDGVSTHWLSLSRSNEPKFRSSCPFSDFPQSAFKIWETQQYDDKAKKKKNWKKKAKKRKLLTTDLDEKIKRGRKPEASHLPIWVSAYRLLLNLKPSWKVPLYLFIAEMGSYQIRFVVDNELLVSASAELRFLHAIHCWSYLVHLV